MTAQNAVGVLCYDFKLNNETPQFGKEYRKLLESVLSNLKNPPLIIEREKIPELLLRIQEERNLFEDIRAGEIGTLRAAKVDYVIYGSFYKKISSDKYDFYLESIKLLSNNSFSKNTFPVLRFTESEIQNTEVFESRLKGLLKDYSFIDGIGLIDNSQLNEIGKRLDQKDNEIANLTRLVNNNKAKEDSLRKLIDTAPLVRFGLELKDNNLIVLIKFDNEVPIEIRPFLSSVIDLNNSEVKGGGWVIHERKRVFPPKDRTLDSKIIFDNLTNKGISLDMPLIFTFYMHFSSIYYAETNNPDSQNKIVKIKFKYDPHTKAFYYLE